MSTTNPTTGLQRDDKTIALFKSIREFDVLLGAAGPGVYNDALGIKDEVGDYDLTGVSSPQIGNGPLGADGWNQATPQFSRAFVSTAAGYVNQTATIDQAFNDAVRATHTQQFVIRHDWDHTAERGIFGGQNQVGGGAANDWLDRISVSAGGHITLFWENNDTNYSRTTTSTSQGDPPIRSGLWQVVTVVWTAATGYFHDVYVHTLETDGSITGGLVESFGDLGLLPLSTSGVGNGHLGYGVLDDNGPANWIGEIAFGRIVKTSMNADTILAQATELLTTGTLASVALTDDLFRHEFNEPPDWIDESVYGIHGESAHVVDYGTGQNHIDLIGSGGRARRNASALTTLYGLRGAQAIRAKFGGADRMSDLFNENNNNPPEWTMQWWGLWLGSTSLVIADWQAGGETEATNFLLQLSMTSGSLSNFSERGAGVNNSVVGLTGSWDAGNLAITEQPMLVTIRSDDDGFGAQRIRLSINDDIDVLSFTMSNTPTGGNAALGLRWGWPAGGFVQEFKLNAEAIPDAQITADYARTKDTEGGKDLVPPVIQNVTPAPGTELTSRRTPIEFDVIDLDPGVSAVLVTVQFGNKRGKQVIYDGSAFVEPYNTPGSQVSVITDGLHFRVEPLGEWLGDIDEFFVYAIDIDGNIEGLP